MVGTIGFRVYCGWNRFHCINFNLAVVRAEISAKRAGIHTAKKEKVDFSFGICGASGVDIGERFGSDHFEFRMLK